ncbi:chemotaxis response regulator protein-glutamate methylesterase [Paenibacillus naphthalenovorans]|uniref:protein-glutamate methylesterase/protein-glutamine glutaminase n=1 Tax=Paenibacillus naphthalenovorans TaxID=162209 RepID=UPI0010B171D1|nr:chemotaxis response regulator protein-glutamate methylesterase [Paenibacillus naphthalenovorans]GCL73214.1 chemotaxis response regulator protein-glutamate methylesterase [Paenibacillus naphthalenovorans]
MSRYGVLIVDDSAFMRRAISLLIEKDPDFFIVGIARNGLEAIEKIKRFKPDVVTMDVEMPEMDGITALEQIMKYHPVAVVMLSTLTGEGAEATLTALQLGAVDFFPKSSLMKDPAEPKIIDDFLMRVKAAASAKLPLRNNVVSVKEAVEENKKRGSASVDLLIIGCSTGGPSAIQSILPRFTPDFPAGIVVLQHMPPGFTKPLADRFDNLCNLKVKEAEDGDVVMPGVIYVAPAGYQTLFQKTNDGKTTFKIVVDESKLYKPSIDVSLQSGSSIYRDRLLVVILTGMGTDGLIGCGEVKRQRGHVIVESEESCIVYGMPKAVYEAGYADRQVSLPNIYQEILSFI